MDVQTDLHKRQARDQAHFHNQNRSQSACYSYIKLTLRMFAANEKVFKLFF